MSETPENNKNKNKRKKSNVNAKSTTTEVPAESQPTTTTTTTTEDQQQDDANVTEEQPKKVKKVYIRKPRPRVGEGEEEFAADSASEESDDDSLELSDDDASEDELLVRIAKVRNKDFITPRRQRKRRVKNGESAAARKAQMKARNKDRAKSSDVVQRAAAADVAFIPGMGVGSLCDSHGIPHAWSHPGFQNMHGCFVLQQDADDARFLVQDKIQRAQDVAERKRFIQETALAKRNAVLEREAERRLASTGAFDCPEFRKLLGELGVDADATPIIKAVMRMAGKACLDVRSDQPLVAAVGAERVTAALAQLRANIARLASMLSLCEVPSSLDDMLPSHLADDVLAALESDDPARVVGAFHALVVNHYEAEKYTSWRCAVASFCTPCFDVKERENADEMRALLEADDSGLFEVEEDIVSIAGSGDFDVIGRRAQAKFDRVLEECGVVGPLPPHFEQIRIGLSDRGAENARLMELPIAQLRVIAKERNVLIKGLTLKEEIVARIMDKFIKLDAERRFDLLLRDARLCGAMHGCTIIRQFLEAHCASELLPTAVALFHPCVDGDTSMSELAVAATNCAIKAIANERIALFNSFAPSDASTHNWCGARITSNHVEQARALLASAGSIVGSTAGPAELVESVLATAEQQIVEWMEEQRLARIEHRKRKAAIDALLAELGFAPNTQLISWAPLLTDKAALRANQALCEFDPPLLNAVVENISLPIHVPPAIGWRVQRRFLLLDALRLAGVTDESAIPMYIEKVNVIHTYLTASRIVRSRAAASRFVGDVGAAQIAGDIFLSLPLLVFFNICQYVPATDLISAATVSDAFGLGASVWLVESKRDKSALSQRVIVPEPYAYFRRGRRMRW